VRTCEWIAAGYLAYLVLAAWVVRPAPRQRARVVGGAALVAAAVIYPALRPPAALFDLWRDWLPGAYLLAGYWLSGLLRRDPALGLERRLVRMDRAVFATLGLDRFVAVAPRGVLEFFELAYLVCYPLVPAGLAVLYATGLERKADAYWTAVLAAGFLSYGTLPWFTTRPPRALHAECAMGRRGLAVRRLNLRVLDRASIQVNTLPSGHVACAVASALVLAVGVPWAGVFFGVMAAGIAAGAVLGRYHYAVDALAGAAAALAGAFIAG
jgi:hypothetical protein